MSLAPLDTYGEKRCLAPCQPDMPCECRDRFKITNMNVNSSYWHIYASHPELNDEKQTQVHPVGR